MAKTVRAKRSNLTKKVIEYNRVAPPADVKKGKGLARRQRVSRVSKLRESITPGTVVILLSGPYRGKRVICLKPLRTSGLVLVTGPFTVNGVPLKRVNHRYVIATSTKIDVSGVDTNKFDDSYFGRPKAEKNKARKMKRKEDESIFMSQGEEKKQKLPEEKKKDQAALDAPLHKILNKDPILTQYLKTRFTLRNNMFPHQLKF